MQPTSTAPNTHLYGLLLMVLAITLMGQFGHQLWTPDEPREAAIAWEMFTSRELAIPTLGGSSFIEKPPIYYILTIPFLALLHDNLGVTVALRLVGALWAMATLLFTGLLARRILGSRTAALWSVIALGTMEGFIMNSHWIRVDTSLAFFVAFTMWAFAEWYLADRQHMLWCAGLGLSLCFLVKGPIGPITLFFGWLALFLPALKRHLAHQEGGRFVIQHLGMTLLFVAPIAGWLLALWQHPEGESLWQQWFWQNQVGRLTGSSAELGHIKPGEYLFYLGGLAEYTLPWLPLVLLWCWQTFRQKQWSASRLFLLSWALGTLLLLSIASTKRTLYLFPLMPVFALMIGQLSVCWPRWLNGYGRGWTLFMFLFALALLMAPFYLPLLPLEIPDNVLRVISTLGWRHVFAAILLIFAVEQLWRWREIHGATLLASAAGIMFMLTFILAYPAIDAAKNMKDDTQHFLFKIPIAQRTNIAGWQFGETERGLFSVYGDWQITNVDKARLNAILTCQDPVYTSLLINQDDPHFQLAQLLAEQPYRLLATGHPRVDKDARAIYWVKGRCLP
ncbi:dolichyl-phosphate-mannose--protein mannosyltransferase [Aeromonas hydrophila]|uniref:ArnT family glycosyltransferase n=1 Tax=Aeromonas hydrophila TaxID=644 RepID=UPI001115B906|nr:phospholipid carrier-dependent glycosyltransferase [Aeromonas hydrophila]MCP3322720.1 phospholipid carrier-dependent glycosyltransferase [Aeromonas hydrophila]TNH90500.1 dolichyl-phosphate-mannose--protein mannosyltransferase [Aeromonas hydrophila]